MTQGNAKENDNDDRARNGNEEEKVKSAMGKGEPGRTHTQCRNKSVTLWNKRET